MTSNDRLKNRTRRGLPARWSSPRNSANGTTSSNRTTDATYFLHITKTLPKSIVLVNGEELAKYLIEYNVGVSVKKTYDIKRIDLDYFEE